MRRKRQAARAPNSDLERSNATFVAALARADAAEASSIYADGATLLPPGSEPVCGRQAIEDFWRAGIEVGLRSVELETLELSAGGELAYELGRYRLVVERDAGATTELGNHVVVHRRQADGAWKRALDVFAAEEPRS